MSTPTFRKWFIMPGNVTVKMETYEGTPAHRLLGEGDSLTVEGITKLTIERVGPVSDRPTVAAQWDNRESLDLDDPFEKAVFELVEMNRKKRKDYAVDGDPFSNFQGTSNHFGFSPWESAEFNLVQKVERLRSLRANGRMDEPENESVGDTYLDAAVYAIITYALYSQGSCYASGVTLV